VVPDEACKSAIAKGIVVNTIHCGNEADGANGGWRKGAALAEGKYLIIDQDKAVVHVEAPQDAEIVKLSLRTQRHLHPLWQRRRTRHRQQLGAGQQRQRLQVEWHRGAAGIDQRQRHHLEQQLGPRGCDQARRQNARSLARRRLARQMKDMKPEERQAYVDKKAAERAELQKQINALNAERQKFVAQKQKEMGQDKTLDTAIATTVREQAAKKDFKFE